MRGRRKMAIFASLNPHISSAGQQTPTKFGTLVERPGVHFHAKGLRAKPIPRYRRRSVPQMRQNWHPRRLWRRLAPKLRPRPPFFILPFGKVDVPLKLC